ncbi:hypothetical protein M231_05379 [Tremella mesenterica]|uniref:N-acetyltransferase domain-containing protein n=1 Tax=Tremella mesenterica TaxID=5217 RepID=A0A4Q1BID9_TREME|nr:hypothetical protein M231_05379 [Tremella mesenterica]
MSTTHQNDNTSRASTKAPTTISDGQTSQRASQDETNTNAPSTRAEGGTAQQSSGWMSRLADAVDDMRNNGTFLGENPRPEGTTKLEVFIEEQGYPSRIEIGDPEDPISTHFLMSKDGKEIGTARITPQGKLGRVAILKSYRGQGLAKPLLNAVHEWVRSKGGKIVYCDSQAADPETGGVDARGVYLKLGYRPVGDLYIKENTLHQRMQLDLE